jgi:hypothetical protein
MTERTQRYVPRSVRRTTRGFSLVLVLLIAIYVAAEIWDESDLVQGLVAFLAFLSFLVTLRALNSSPRTVYINVTAMALVLVAAIVGRPSIRTLWRNRRRSRSPGSPSWPP